VKKYEARCIKKLSRREAFVHNLLKLLILIKKPGEKGAADGQEKEARGGEVVE
jgi:hypothetical protein